MSQTIVEPAQGKESFRVRIDVAIGAIFAAAIVALTAATVIESRAELLRAERMHAVALVEHLARMVAGGSSVSAMQEEITRLQKYVSSRESTVELVPAGSPAPQRQTVLGERKVPFGVLRYSVANERLSALTWRAILIHGLTASIALVLMLIIVELMLRRRVLQPLESFRRQINHISRGGGWTTVLPEVDAELQELRRAISRVGPALGAQTLAWIETERRATTALIVRRIRSILDHRLPALLANIERLAQSRSPSADRLLEACQAEEELLSIESALSDLETMVESPSPRKEGHS